MIMWAIQMFLALAFGAAGTMKLVRSKPQLAANPQMGWVHSVPDAAAACLAALMGGAVATHMIRGEPAAVATALVVLTIAVATFR
jgi:hypothetical protein